MCTQSFREFYDLFAFTLTLQDTLLIFCGNLHTRLNADQADIVMQVKPGSRTQFSTTERSKASKSAAT